MLLNPFESKIVSFTVNQWIFFEDHIAFIQPIIDVFPAPQQL